MYQIIICEDDPAQNAYIKKSIEQIDLPIPVHVYSYMHSEEILKSDIDKTLSTIFLMDIVLDKENGIEKARQLHDQFMHSVVIFISAYLEKVTDIYEANHCYFIYKPELDMRLQKALMKAITILQSMQKVLSIRSGSKQKVIPIKNIAMIERVKRYSYIHTETEVIRVTESLEELFSSLSASFHQCHRSYLINFEHVKEMQRTDFLTDTGLLVPISRTYSKEIQQAFQSYLIHQFY